MTRSTLLAWVHGMRRRHGPLDNIYLAGVQKTGSQWLKQIFSDRHIEKLTGMVVYPQHRYDVDEFHTVFPKNAVIPGLYVSYRLYSLFIRKPERYKTIYVIRDPRNIVVSWYYSALKTHPEMAGLSVTRKVLQDMDRASGIAHSIKWLGVKFADMRSWAELGSADDNVMLVRLEDITAAPEALGNIFSFCGLDVSDELLEIVFNTYSKPSMRNRDLANRLDKSESHYRSRESRYQEEFLPEHYELFYNTTGNLVDILGYDR